MLLSLHVKNFAIIDEVEVYFKDHLNILTGETGAGKSILIDSINVALGGKVTKDIIRKNCEYALVELVFVTNRPEVLKLLEENDLPTEDGQILISRKIMTNGRSICKLNGENVTAQLLKDIATLLLDIHGQHEHQSLLYKHKHLEMIDRFAKEEAAVHKEKVQELYHSYQKLKEEYDNAEIDEDKRLRELSFLEYEMNEIEEAKLVMDEDISLQAEYKKLSNANLINENLSGAYKQTSDSSDSAADLVSRAVKFLSKISEYDLQLNGFLTQLIDIEGLLNDFNRDVSEYLSDSGDGLEGFIEVENRLNLINHLKSKYGNSIGEIFNYYKNLDSKKKKYEAYDEYLQDLRQKIDVTEQKLRKECEILSSIRRKTSSQLAEKMKAALIDLNFLDVNFEIEIKQLNNYTVNGLDEAEFMISTNPGEPIRPLAKIASGGELSRIMLAIKSVMAKKDDIQTLIFDEIDVGISGRTAQKVSEKLGLLAGEHQILCITHLPQIAAMADTHFIIEKNTDGISTNTNIRQLDETEVVQELARILGGAKITDNVLTNALEMKELANHTKKYR
ncbi:DNA repair protein RecN [Lachnoclostridium phytofermentans]|uniref:DNA repair protein RecN n=1 Tax=Lachnoclostridium phytofermentans (strain ATCC 700394 / DSM 18823 / ISDg) TaxID=357809 RepID=A9KMA6_LACP7|nr:DNA repair protein RecN [Lachnoclostridium phytofermentans]ABX42860.1 DNA repair protein RecN [Lachnoclostridium phytofermentans ISDg]